ncbi:Pvc16 family protein [Burkholderia ambifaria]|uniref:Pvc16 N-terminal domain-containing protein n=1 Tax=Burkholderia ambifaria MEX-5 TaxID=396597 RepID=B1TDE6_9BURK|nr:Pvc16 family protein [Burkholderia ambifaria]EDT38416.1 conserved hypothetical protein [Burkholderia ambifaria MEX-5]
MAVELLKSDERILDLNEQIRDALRKYVSIQSDCIRFDMPDKDHTPAEPTLCVFLYDIQEDLKLRHTQPRTYHPASGSIEPKYVMVRCCYLLTYWDPLTTNASGPRSQTMIVMNQVLNTLLNLEAALNQDSNVRQEPGPAQVRVIESSEHLSGLGNFWQSLGDKPRLCLNLAITVPVALTSQENTVVPVGTLVLKAQSSSASLEQISNQFKEALISRVKPGSALERHQLGNLAIVADWSDVRKQQRGDTVNVHVAGLLAKALYTKVVGVLGEPVQGAEWQLDYAISADYAELKQGPEASTMTSEGE